MAESDTANIAAILDEVVPGLMEGSEGVAEADVRSGLGGWIAAVLAATTEDRAAKLGGELVEEIRDFYDLFDATDQAAWAASSLSRYRIERISERIGDLARRAGSDKAKTPDSYVSYAQDDLAEIRTIESELSAGNPDVYRAMREMLSESKLDAFFIVRGGGATSLRLGRHLAR